MGESIFQWRTRIQWAGLFCGPVLALIGYGALPTEFLGEGGAPAEFSVAGRVTLAIMAWMAVWWITEAVGISVTALLPLVLFPLTGIRTIEDTAAPTRTP